jgi:hypothetical protein
VDYFLTASVLVSLAAGAGVALLVASALTTSGFAFFSVLAGLEAVGAGALVVAAGAGVAGALAGSAANTVAANKAAITVAIAFMIFPFWLSRNFYPYIYITP